MKNPFGIPSQREREYARPERLADVMALIQVLTLAEHSHRSEKGIRTELQGPPRSVDSWEALARDHPEFFRVLESGTYTVALLARHVDVPETEGRPRPRAPLPADFVGNLLNSAVDIHDRQVRRSERWTYLVPIWVALILGILGLLGTLIRLLLS